MVKSGLSFLKMHGAGNDFVIIDARCDVPYLNPRQIALIGDRHFGVGFDQMAIIYADDDVDARLVFYNADGSESATCGNATRCIAALLQEELGRHQITLRTERGDLPCDKRDDGLTVVNMGQPMFGWQDIPLSQNVDTLHLPIEGDPVATGLGNPHLSFIVDDADGVDLNALGARLENHPLFPMRTNVEYLSLIKPDEIRMRIWERGVGITLASGSGACAAALTAARRGLTKRTVRVHADGGVLEIDWRDDGVWMAGPVALMFKGEINSAVLDSA